MILVILLWVSLLMGQLGGIPLRDGVVLYVQDIALFLTILGAALRFGLLRKFWKFRLIRPIGLFVILGVLSLVVNIARYPLWVTALGSLYLWRWVAYALFYAVVLVSPFSLRFWLGWLGGFGIALASIGLVQFVWYPDLRNLWYLGWDPHYYRLFATLLDPNYVGILLVLTIFVLSYLRILYTKWRAWIVVIMSVVGIALLLTFSRSSYLAFLGGIVVSILFLKRWKEGVFFTLFFLIAVVYIPKPGGDTLSLFRRDSTVARIQNWGQTITRIGERPVLGYGFNVVPFIDREEALNLPGRKGAGIDSSILFVGVMTGVVGVFGYLWLMAEQVLLAARSKNTSLKILVLSSFASICVHSVFVNSLFYPWVMIWMWALVGIVERERKNATVGT